MSKYFLIHATEDGVSIDEFGSPDELETILEECGIDDPTWVDPDHDWHNASDQDVAIIRGEVVKAKPKKVVKTWDLV